MNQFEPAYC